METRRLGRTGHRSSVVTFGGAAIGRVDQATADRAIEAALAAGVNHVDVAPTYGDAELRLQPWIARNRDRIFLGGKTRERDREAAKAQLHRSLERLGTDRFDLYQLHSVGKLADLDACTAAGGALETLVEARAEGLVRWLGITGHTHDAPADPPGGAPPVRLRHRDVPGQLRAVGRPRLPARRRGAAGGVPGA